MSYDVGDELTLTVKWFDDAGALADPTTVTCTVYDPGGASTTPTPASSATGIWAATFTPTAIGVHAVKWVATGAVVAVQWDRVVVRDAEAETKGGPFPYGKQSWVSAVN